MCQYRILEPDERGSLRGETVKKAIEEDVKNGLYPYLVVGSVGTTGGCFFDKIREIAEACKKYETCWLHVDGAYAGSSFICPENRKFMDGFEFIDSFNTNGNKFCLANFDLSCLWAKDNEKLCEGFVIDPVYLHHENDNDVIDLRHYGIPLSRRFRALKLFFIFRLYGVEGIQKYHRNHMKLAKYFEGLVRLDDRFEIMNDVYLGLVGFRLK
jgi:glutamate/tyrosine decarboxylase-like PLP-dependent enzyme